MLERFLRRKQTEPTAGYYKENKSRIQTEHEEILYMEMKPTTVCLQRTFRFFVRNDKFKVHRNENRQWWLEFPIGCGFINRDGRKSEPVWTRGHARGDLQI